MLEFIKIYRVLLSLDGVLGVEMGVLGFVFIWFMVWLGVGY